jgi:hypothetical protein
MFPRVTHVRHLKEFRLEITFADGRTGELDFANRVLGREGVFIPLQNIEFFSQVRVDLEAGTLVWPNDVDLDPDILYSAVSGDPLPKWSTGRIAAMIELTKQQQRVLDAEDEQPPRVIDPRTHKAYVLVRVEDYERIKVILEDEHQQATFRQFAMRNAVGRMDEEP